MKVVHDIVDSCADPTSASPASENHITKENLHDHKSAALTGRQAYSALEQLIPLLFSTALKEGDEEGEISTVLSDSEGTAYDVNTSVHSTALSENRSRKREKSINLQTLRDKFDVSTWIIYSVRHALQPLESLCEDMQALSHTAMELPACGDRYGSASTSHVCHFVPAVEGAMKAGLGLLQHVTVLMEIDVQVQNCIGKISASDAYRDIKYGLPCDIYCIDDSDVSDEEEEYMHLICSEKADRLLLSAAKERGSNDDLECDRSTDYNNEEGDDIDSILRRHGFADIASTEPSAVPPEVHTRYHTSNTDREGDDDDSGSDDEVDRILRKHGFSSSRTKSTSVLDPIHSRTAPISDEDEQDDLAATFQKRMEARSERRLEKRLSKFRATGTLSYDSSDLSSESEREGDEDDYALYLKAMYDNKYGSLSDESDEDKGAVGGSPGAMGEYVDNGSDGLDEDIAYLRQYTRERDGEGDRDGTTKEARALAAAYDTTTNSTSQHDPYGGYADPSDDSDGDEEGYDSLDEELFGLFADNEVRPLATRPLFV